MIAANPRGEDFDCSARVAELSQECRQCVLQPPGVRRATSVDADDCSIPGL